VTAAGVVVDNGQVPGALVDQCMNELDRAAGLAATALAAVSYNLLIMRYGPRK
jgi:hypothetical protein